MRFGVRLDTHLLVTSCVLISQLSRLSTAQPAVLQYTCVVVPGRNRTLFCCIFCLSYCAQSAIAQNYHEGLGSYVLRRLIRYLCFFTVCMSPALNRSFALYCFDGGSAVKLHNGLISNFYPGLSRVYGKNHSFSTKLHR